VTEEDEELLAELLLRWDELREQGQDVSSIELCHAYPQLAQELEHRIVALRKVDWLDKQFELVGPEEKGRIDIREPKTLGQRYRLDELVAEGGFAEVWRAYDLELHRNVAVKLPKPSRLDSTDAFMAEARRVARLKHPGIIPIFDVGREDGKVFIVSEFVEGGNLTQQIKRVNPTQKQAIQWTTEVAEALQYAHDEGIIHRDIKPANILVDHHGRALLADFGIAQSASKTGRFAPSIGTLRYMAPEQLEGKEIDHRSDIYSLGVVLYELLTGNLPYSSDHPATVKQEIVSGVRLNAQEIPAGLLRVCETALKRTPQGRFPTAKAFAEELKNLSKPPPRNGGWFPLFVLVPILCIGMFYLVPSGLKEGASQSESRAMDPEWIAHIATLPPEMQIAEVIAKLKELNPEFDGTVMTEQKDGRVILWDMRTDHVTNISPLAALKHLRSVNLSGTFTWKHNGKLVDISPLEGMSIENLEVTSTLVEDLSPLRNAPLTFLRVDNSNVTDLSPISHAKLTRLFIHNTMISDLAPIRGMALTYLHMANTQVNDLSVLSGMPLEDLRCQYCGIKDMSVLEGMPLHTLEIHGNPLTDLSPLANSPMQYLNIYKTGITDWSALRTMRQLKMISFDFDRERDSEILRSVTTLELINERPAEDFWKWVRETESQKIP
jgi:serine/threonine-protein kinase